MAFGQRSPSVQIILFNDEFDVEAGSGIINFVEGKDQRIHNTGFAIERHQNGVNGQAIFWQRRMGL